MRVGQTYYFWDKKRKRLGDLLVVAVYKHVFYFSYRGKTYKCRYEYAKGKIFEDDMEVPQYREEVKQMYLDRARRADEIAAIERRFENKKINESYRPASDTWVVYGD